MTYAQEAARQGVELRSVRARTEAEVDMRITWQSFQTIRADSGLPKEGAGEHDARRDDGHEPR